MVSANVLKLQRYFSKTKILKKSGKSKDLRGAKSSVSVRSLRYRTVYRQIRCANKAESCDSCSYDYRPGILWSYCKLNKGTHALTMIHYLTFLLAILAHVGLGSLHQTTRPISLL